MRMINADEIIEKLIVFSDSENGNEHFINGIETAKELIEQMQAVDAVPVIRCYECKYFREFEKGFSTDWDGSCKYWNTHSTVYSNFCGCAERKEE